MSIIEDGMSYDDYVLLAHVVAAQVLQTATIETVRQAVPMLVDDDQMMVRQLLAILADVHRAQGGSHGRFLWERAQ